MHEIANLKPGALSKSNWAANKPPRPEQNDTDQS